MKAVVFEGTGAFRYCNVNEPIARPGQALIGIRSTTFCATDRKLLAGRFPMVRFPQIPGHEWSGEVLAIGEGVHGLGLGDRVAAQAHVGCGYCARCLEGLYVICENFGRTETGHQFVGFTVPGGLAEYCAVSARALHRIPPGVNFDTGAFVDSLGTALYAVERGELAAGETVTVLGPGAIGLLAVQVTRAKGASKIAVVGTRADRLRIAAAIGADITINLAEVDDPIQKIKDAFGGRGPDIVVEFAGAARAVRDAIAMARQGGRIVLGGSSGTVLDSLDLTPIIRGHLAIYGTLATPKGIDRRAIELMRTGLINVRPLITEHRPLAEFNEAWSSTWERPGGAIRVMLHPNE